MDALSPASELRALVSCGDLRAAGEWLVERYAADVVGLCRSMVRQRDLAEDLAQDVFSSAFSSLGGYRADAAPRTWLLTIARHRCIDHLRRSHREPWVDAGEDGNEPDHHADDAPLAPELLLRREDVEAALDELGENERALVVLRFRHGLEYPELASVFGLREGTVRMRLSRALGRMRERLELLHAEPMTACEPDPSPRAAPSPRPAAARPARPTVPAAAPSLAFGSGGGPAGGAPPTGAPPAPGAPPPPPAAAPLPVVSAAAPPPARASASGSAKGQGLFSKARRWLTREPTSSDAAPPTSDSELAGVPSPLGLALASGEPDVSATLRDKLARLVASLPGR